MNKDQFIEQIKDSTPVNNGASVAERIVDCVASGAIPYDRFEVFGFSGSLDVSKGITIELSIAPADNGDEK